MEKKNIIKIVAVAVVLIILAICAYYVQGTNVDCGWGNYPDCNEQEVQNAVNQLDNYNDWQDDVIYHNYVWDYYQDQDLYNQQSYIYDNEASWRQDIVGGGGISRGTAAEMMTGDSRFFNNYDNLLQYTDKQYCSNAKNDALELRVIELERQVKLMTYFLSLQGYDKDSNELAFNATMVGWKAVE